MNEVIQQAEKIKTMVEEMKDDFFHCDSARTYWQAKNLAIGRQITKSHRYLSAVNEMFTYYIQIKSKLIDVAEIEWKQSQILGLKAQGKPTNPFEEARLEVQLELIEHDLDRCVKEFFNCMKIRDEQGSFTREDIERDSETELKQRLALQSLEEIASKKTGISVSNIREMRWAGMIKLGSEGFEIDHKMLLETAQCKQTLFIDRLTQPQLNGHG